MKSKKFNSSNMNYILQVLDLVVNGHTKNTYGASDARHYGVLRSVQGSFCTRIIEGAGSEEGACVESAETDKRRLLPTFPVVFHGRWTMKAFIKTSTMHIQIIVNL